MAGSHVLAFHKATNEEIVFKCNKCGRRIGFPKPTGEAAYNAAYVANLERSGMLPKKNAKGKWEVSDQVADSTLGICDG